MSTESIISSTDTYFCSCDIIIRKGEGKTIALRVDIDALPINEETRLRVCVSENDGAHACGHDSCIDDAG